MPSCTIYMHVINCRYNIAMCPPAPWTGSACSLLWWCCRGLRPPGPPGMGTNLLCPVPKGSNRISTLPIVGAWMLCSMMEHCTTDAQTVTVTKCETKISLTIHKGLQAVKCWVRLYNASGTGNLWGSGDEDETEQVCSGPCCWRKSERGGRETLELNMVRGTNTLVPWCAVAAEGQPQEEGKKTLPAVVKECLIGKRPYETVVWAHTLNIFSKMSKALKSDDSRGVVLELFREIYSFILIGDIEDSALTRLVW